MSTALLERGEELELLASALDSASGGLGTVVLVAGEAGIGKSSLLQAFAASSAHRARVLRGACEDLVTPRTLGAVRDAFTGSTRLATILAEGTRDDLLDGVLAELTEATGPTVLVVEDIHWADDATLDVLRYVCRRIQDSPAMVIISYRDEEIGRAHPAQRLLGGLGGPSVHRLVVPRLTRAAVATLAGGNVATSAALYQLTAGNAFYVTEVVASGDDAVPLTVADAVLARIHQLPPEARTALEQLAVVPSQVELPLARALVGDLTVLAEAERRGLVGVRADAVSFRHELARRAVADSLPASERMRAHARVLDVLTAGEDVDPPRIVHHAVEAADDQRVVDLAPRAAAHAAQLGSYTQEIACYRLLVEREHLMDRAEIAGIRQRMAAALYMVDEPAESEVHALAAVRIREELGDVAALGEALICLAPTQWQLTRTDEAMASTARAVELLSSVPETPIRTVALLWRSLGMSLVGHAEDLSVAEEATASAARTGVPELLGMSRTCLGQARLAHGDVEEGLELMRAGLAATRAANAHTFALLTWGPMAMDLFALMRYEECGHELDRAIAYANECETWFFATSWRAFGHRLQALHGEWEDAIAGLRGIVGTRGEPEKGSLRYALAPLARLLARQGAPDAPATLAWACDFARRAECYPEWVSTGMAEIETAWITGRPAAATAAVARLDDLTARRGREAERGELNRWKRRLALPHEVPPGCPEVFAAGIRGDWPGAAARWEAIGAPYEQALELLDAGEVDPTLRALHILDDLAAEPVAQRARRQLRELGVSRIPQRPLPTTRANPGGLTARQVDVLRLLAEGLTNAEIAARLVISQKTADHHVSAILTKLDVPNRRRAVVAARTLGLTPDHRPGGTSVHRAPDRATP